MYIARWDWTSFSICFFMVRSRLFLCPFCFKLSYTSRNERSTISRKFCRLTRFFLNWYEGNFYVIYYANFNQNLTFFFQTRAPQINWQSLAVGQKLNTEYSGQNESAITHTFFRLLWPCIMNVGWRERNQQDATNPMFVIKLLSEHVSGIIMLIIRRTRVCTAAYGALHWLWWLWLCGDGTRAVCTVKVTVSRTVT